MPQKGPNSYHVFGRPPMMLRHGYKEVLEGPPGPGSQATHEAIGLGTPRLLARPAGNAARAALQPLRRRPGAGGQPLPQVRQPARGPRERPREVAAQRLCQIPLRGGSAAKRRGPTQWRRDRARALELHPTTEPSLLLGGGGTHAAPAASARPARAYARGG